MGWSNDPVADAMRHQAQLEELASRYHYCVECGRILDDYAYDINGNLLCLPCVNKIFRVDVDNL